MSLDHVPVSLAIRLLGGVAIEASDGGRLPTVPHKGWAVLSLLASEPGIPQPRDRLAEIFWPDLPLDAARNNLRQVLLALQRVLKNEQRDGSCLVADRRVVRLDAIGCGHCRVDLVDFAGEPPECTSPMDPSRCLGCLATMEAMVAFYRRGSPVLR